MRLGSLLILALLAGCAPKVRWFQPSEPMYKYFHRTNTDDVETKKAMLECGFPDPFRGDRQGYDFESTVLAGICMENDGFSYEIDGQVGWCIRQSKSLCVPSRKDVPRRSVERRLSSPYCKEFSSVLACK